MQTSNKLYSLLLLSALPISAMAEPPRPPLGKKWVLNHTFSDEFNGTELDKSKWYDYHPTWAGREPGIFLPSQITVHDGLMRIKGEKLEQDKVITSADIVTDEGTERTYSIAGGAVISKTEDAYFGYYESRFKAAKTTMSTTFWLATRNWDFPGPKDCDDRYGLELDIQESIGREGNFDGKIFAKGMHSNGHFWYADCDGKMQDLRSPKVNFKKNNFASDSFNTYGGWWHNESSASFYFNDGAPKFMTFYSEVKDKPFDQPMGVNLVSETYPFPWVELPNSQELADPNKNVAYYDWVRAYLLVDANAANPTNQDGNVATPAIYAESIKLHLDSATLIDSNKIEVLTEYQTNQRRVVNIELKDQQGNIVAFYKTLVDPGFAFVPVELIATQSLSLNQVYHLTSSVLPESSINTQLALSQPPLFQQNTQLPNLSTLNKQHKVVQGLPVLAPTELGIVTLTQEPGVYHYSVVDYGVVNSHQKTTLEGITYDNTIDLSALPKGNYIIKLDGVQVARFTGS